MEVKVAAKSHNTTGNLARKGFFFGPTVEQRRKVCDAVVAKPAQQWKVNDVMQTSANISLHRSAAIIHLYLPRAPLPGDRLAVDEVRCVRGGEFITPNAAPPPRVRVLVALGVCCRWRSGESRVERGADWKRNRLS